MTWTQDHPLSLFGLGVLLDEFGECFDWSWLRALHHKAGAYLETADYITVLRALGLFAGEIHDLSDYIRPLNPGKSRTPRVGEGYSSADQETALTID